MPRFHIENILNEAERIRSSLRLLREYDYQTAVLDVLRCSEIAADELLYASDDPWRAISIGQTGLQGFGMILQWLPNRAAKWTYRPSQDRIDKRCILACRDAFQFAFDFEVLSSAVRLYREGLLSCAVDGNHIKFSINSPRPSFLRGLLDNIASDSERPEWTVPDREFQTVDDARILRQAIAEQTATHLIDELDLIPNEIQVNGYQMGQFKAVWRALMIDALMWRSRPQRNPLKTSIEDQLREAVKVVRVSNFVHSLAQAAGQKREVVRSVVTDLLYRKNFDSVFDVWMNPLVAIGTEHIALAPRLVTRNRIARNFPKIWLTRHRNCFHSTVGSRILEKSYIEKIRKLVEPLADPHLMVVNKELQTFGIEIDLAFVDAGHDTLLMVEAKCIIAPDSLREQLKARDTALKGVGQMQRILEWARTNPGSALAALFGKTGRISDVKQVSGLVVCNWSYGPEEPADVPIVSHYGIARCMQTPTRPQTAAGLLESLKDARTIDPNVERLQYSEYVFSIGKFQIGTPITEYLTFE